MQPADDYPLGPGHGPSAPPPRAPRRESAWRVWIVTVLCLVVAAAAAIYLSRSKNTETTGTQPVAPARQPAVPTARGPLGPAVEPRDLPPLDLTDPLVRQLLKGLSSRPELAAWLATDGLIRTIVASVDAIANGTTPSTHLRRLAPAAPFSAEPRGEDFVIDLRSYRRYDGIADTVSTLDAHGLARAYATLRPRLQEAYVELGYPDGNFDDAVARAIQRLLETPVVEQDVDVRPAPVLYQFTDSRLERLAPAQKQLLRMGPRNGRLIQSKLREVATALGVPVEHVP
jgi:Protein of unknown function (DUF3014)